MSSKEAEDLCLSHRALITIPQRQMISSSSWRQQTVSYPQLRGPRRTVAGTTPWPASCVAPNIPAPLPQPRALQQQSPKQHGPVGIHVHLTLFPSGSAQGPGDQHCLKARSKALGGRGVLGALGYCFPSFEPREDAWRRHLRIKALGP